MSENDSFSSISVFAEHLKYLRQIKRKEKEANRPARTARRSLNRAGRDAVLAKAGHRCHLCGGIVDESDWAADHVFAHSAGGSCLPENFLPAHHLCNQYRWDHGPEEFQWILKLGVWLRTQVEKQTRIGKLAGEAFLSHERRNVKRRKSGPGNSRT